MDREQKGIRSRRKGWAAGERLTLTDRDLAILYLVGVCGVLRTRDITRFFFGARATANDRLRKLFCAGLLDCFVPSLSSDNYYALTALGRDRVCEEHDLDPNTLRLVTKLPKKLDHAIGVTELRLSIAMACRESERYELVSFQTDADLARERHAQLLPIVPDALVSIRDVEGKRTHSFVIEVDLGTEATTWLVRHKLAVYARYAETGTSLYGVRDPVVVLVTSGLRRARNIARTIEAMGVRANVAISLRTMVDERTVLAEAYARPSDLLETTGTDDLAVIFRRRLLP